MSIPEEAPQKQDLLEAFDWWIYEQRPNGANIMEGSAIMMGLMLRMRQALTFQEVHNLLHQQIVKVEERIKNGATLRGMDGSQIPFVTAEMWRNLEGGHDMIAAVNNPDIPDVVPEEWE